MAKGRFDRIRVAAIILRRWATVLAGVPADCADICRWTGRKPCRRACAQHEGTGLEPKKFRRLDRRRTRFARAWRRAGGGRLLRPRRRGLAGQPAAASRHGRGACRSKATATARCNISPARPQRGATPVDASGPTAASLMTSSASMPQAQADYRAALSATDGDEARRRLALSLAITAIRQKPCPCCRRSWRAAMRRVRGRALSFLR